MQIKIIFLISKIQNDHLKRRENVKAHTCFPADFSYTSTKCPSLMSQQGWFKKVLMHMKGTVVKSDTYYICLRLRWNESGSLPFYLVSL